MRCSVCKNIFIASEAELLPDEAMTSSHVHDNFSEENTSQAMQSISEESSMHRDSSFVENEAQAENTQSSKEENEALPNRDSLSMAEEKTQPKKKMSCLTPLVLLLALGVGGGYFYKEKVGKEHFETQVFSCLSKMPSWVIELPFIAKLDFIQENIEKEKQLALDAEKKNLAEMLKSLKISNVRQYTIPNDSIGNLAIIEGKVENHSDHECELIQLRANLFDANKNTLMTQTQLAGTKASLLQLQVLEKEKLESILNNKIDIKTYNTALEPGASVPFMFIFYNPDAQASDYNIQIISAQKSKPLMN